MGVILGVGKAGDVNCEDGRVKAVGDGGMAGKEEAPLESYPSKSPLCPPSPSALSLRANSPAAVPGVLGLKGQWALWRGRRPQRGFAAWPGWERAGQLGGTPCTQGMRLRLPPAARNHMVRSGDCLLVLNRVC